MSIRGTVAVTVGKGAQWALRTFTKGGTSLPGKLASKIDPAVLSHLAKEYEVVIITGTNGKTLTTSLTYHVLQQKYPHILTNPTGANMEQGIISSFIEQKGKRKAEKKLAVLEVDEASLVYVTKYIKPKIIVNTNVFRDQMDRFGEIYTIYQKMVDGAALAPEAIVMANGDSPIFNSKDLVNPQVYFGFNHEDDGETMAHYNTDGVLCPQCQKVLHYKFNTYANLGKYYCQNCDFHRPELKYAVTSVDHLDYQSSSFTIDGHPFKINIAGLYNVYNALAAYSVGREFGLTPAEIQAGFASAQQKFGRQETIQVGDKKIILNLIKNPVGLNQIINLLDYENDPISLAVILNDRPADGTDVSWIWDGEFEKLPEHDIRSVAVSGIRREEMHLRLKVAGLPEAETKVYETLDRLLESFKNAPTEKIYVMATYTAVLNLRKELAEKGFIEERMK
ncbi:Mur ligase family protein [Jeotgalibaca caeni]|uniref:Mur ligase family protein n=1 Tax=Jeotgalibaca caeni TaxID=3028623 RepID=UPI00237E5A7E|nr:Mur ligase family protein [Jeotgalibaca caeni]MDE1548874.1 Mur ligase family protein [Jeotgalibaca caeni]